MPATRLICCLLCLSISLAGAGAARASSTDPFFPHSGNRGYDVSSYDVHLSYQPASGRLRATTRIEATASQRLRRFSLDLDGLRVTAVEVEGEAAGIGRVEGKLKVTPPRALPAGQEFATVVRYRGRPEQVIDPDGTPEGWQRTSDGALAVGEPNGTAAWIPCNNSLADKARFSFEISVPAGLKGVANGRLTRVVRRGSRTEFDWRASEPMAPYLAVVDIGRGKLVRETIAGLPAWTLVDPRLAEQSRPALRALPEIIRFESGVLGPYPFDTAGSIVDLTDLGYALETQTRPIYAFAPDLTTVVHETAHQWFGDSVGLKRWPNIWLNEGFATWTEWYYTERHGGRSALQTFRRLYRLPASETRLWEPPSGHPGTAKNLFAPSTYLRGAMTLEALRLKIGTTPMLKILRLWTTRHRYGRADINQFVGLANQVSGRHLGGFFQRWLYRRGKP